MPVQMMHVRGMRVFVSQALMLMAVRVWFARRITKNIRVLMMFVVDMRVRVFHGLMFVQMLVIFSQMQPDADGHQ